MSVFTLRLKVRASARKAGFEIRRPAAVACHAWSRGLNKSYRNIVILRLCGCFCDISLYGILRSCCRFGADCGGLGILMALANCGLFAMNLKWNWFCSSCQAKEKNKEEEKMFFLLLTEITWEEGIEFTAFLQMSPIPTPYELSPAATSEALVALIWDL